MARLPAAGRFPGSARPPANRVIFHELAIPTQYDHGTRVPVLLTIRSLHAWLNAKNHLPISARIGMPSGRHALIGNKAKNNDGHEPENTLP